MTDSFPKYQSTPSPPDREPDIHAHTQTGLCIQIWTSESNQFHFLICDMNNIFIEGDGIRHGDWQDVFEHLNTLFLQHLSASTQKGISNGSITLQ